MATAIAAALQSSDGAGRRRHRVIERQFAGLCSGRSKRGDASRTWRDAAGRRSPHGYLPTSSSIDHGSCLRQGALAAPPARTGGPANSVTEGQKASHSCSREGEVGRWSATDASTLLPDPVSDVYVPGGIVCGRPTWDTPARVRATSVSSGTSESTIVRYLGRVGRPGRTQGAFRGERRDSLPRRATEHE